MARRPPSAAEQFQTDEAAFHKLAEKFDGYKALIEVPAPTECNIEAAAKFALRLVDYWTRCEQSACKLADETCHPDTRRKVEKLKPKVEDFAQQATDLAKQHQKRKQSEEVKKTPLSKVMVESPQETPTEPSRNAAMLKDATH